MPKYSTQQTKPESTKETGITKTLTTDKVFGDILERNHVDFGDNVVPPKDDRYQHSMLEAERQSHMPSLEEYSTFRERVTNASNEATIQSHHFPRDLQESPIV
jgi:hypothetical protein